MSTREKNTPQSTPSRVSMPSLSAVSSQPLDPETAILIFVGVIEAALKLKILNLFALVKQVTVKRLLESLRNDIPARAQLVHDTIGTKLNLAIAQSEREESVDKQSADIAYSLDVLKDDDTVKTLVDGYGLEKIVRLIPLWEFYQLLLQTEWMLRDTEVEREFAFEQCKLLLEHKMYDSKVLVYEHIRNSIGNAAFIANAVPEEKRVLILDTIQEAMKSKTIGTTMLGELIFTAVPLAEFAEYIPARTMGIPFADYAKHLGVSEAPKPAVPPPLPKKETTPMPGELPRAEATLNGASTAEENGRERRDSEGPALSVTEGGDGATTGDDEQEVDVDEEAVDEPKSPQGPSA